MRRELWVILLLGLSCLFLLVLTGPVEQFPRKRRRREVGGENEGSGDGGDGGGGLGGLDHGGLGADGGEEGSGEGNGGKRKGVKESRGTYFFCKYSSFFCKYSPFHPHPNLL